MSKVKYQIKNGISRATYFTSKIAFAPLVAVVDTSLAAGTAVVEVVKTLGKSATKIITAPYQGVVRANQFHTERFLASLNSKLSFNKKLASGDYAVAVVLKDDANA